MIFCCIGLQVPTTYTVTILDVNDNAPVFQNVPYNAQVAEVGHNVLM